MPTSRGTWSRRARAGALVLTLALAAAACDGSGGGGPEPTPTSSAPVKQKKLSFGIWGNTEEIAAYEAMITEFSALSAESDFEVRAYPDRDALVADLRAGGKAPDVFLASRADLAWLIQGEHTVPVDELLDERGVAFGDRYSRNALEAFSTDRRLQCMPYGVSPMVLYVNKDLVDFERMEARGLEVPPEDRSRFTFEQFQAAAAFASRKRRGTKGVAIEPSLRSVAPFVYSGGGDLFDEASDPTSLAFSDDAARDALERTLTVLRDPTLTLSAEQLARRTPLEWFKRGRVGMVEGFRTLVPELRQVRGLDFDVLPMPTLDTPATIGDITGLCISAEAASIPEAADFVVHALSTEAVRGVTRAGYLVPANQEVALTEDFLQPGRQPEHASVFTAGVSEMRVPPLLDVWDELESAVDPVLEEMFEVTVLEDLEPYTTRVDEASQLVLDPDGDGVGEQGEREQQEEQEQE